MQTKKTRKIKQQQSYNFDSFPMPLLGLCNTMRESVLCLRVSLSSTSMPHYLFRYINKLFFAFPFYLLCTGTTLYQLYMVICFLCVLKYINNPISGGLNQNTTPLRGD